MAKHSIYNLPGKRCDALTNKVKRRLKTEGLIVQTREFLLFADERSDQRGWRDQLDQNQVEDGQGDKGRDRECDLMFSRRNEKDGADRVC